MKAYLVRHLTALLCGYILDLAVGDPHGIPHPVAAIGRLISALERKLYPKTGERNPGREQRKGALLCAGVMICTFAVTAAVTVLSYLLHPLAGIAAEAVLTCYILAARSLCEESMKVYRDLEQGDIGKARRDLSMIVGRDTAELNEDAVIRAAVETVAENTSDGVIAPLIYTVAGGPAAGMLYKAVNTMDSMLGYHNERYEYFGKCAALLDDAANFIPSRASALLMIAASAVLSLFSRTFDAGGSYRIWRRDRRNHKSPNAAQTESACAGALGLKLGGDSCYGGVLVRKPCIGDGKRAIEREDIRRANLLMFAAEFLALSGAAGILLFLTV